MTMAPVIDGNGSMVSGTPCFNDILAFMAAKMKVCPRDTLVGIMKSFYRHEDLAKARDILFGRLPETDGRRVKHRKTDEILESMYLALQQQPTDDCNVFLTLDLNNVPCVDVKYVDGASIMCQQSRINNTLEEVLQEQSVMKAQLAELLKVSQGNAVNAGRVGNDRQVSRRNLGSHQPSAVATYASAAAGAAAPQNPGPRADSVRPREQQPSGRTDGERAGRQQQPRADGGGSDSDQTRVSARYIQDTDGFLTRAPRVRRPCRTAAAAEG